MFPRLRPSRFPIRRLIHTQPRSFHHTQGRLGTFAMGALASSALAYTYYLNFRPIHLDSPESTISASSTTTASSDTPPPEPEGESEGRSEGAFNPETGEINWDCPCLGGMAHGPCGEEFKAAFSCFVFSEADPKGIDCIEKFSAMQNCFRAHPEVYADQLSDDEEEVGEVPAPETETSESDVPQTQTTEHPREQRSSSPSPTESVSKSTSASS